MKLQKKAPQIEAIQFKGGIDSAIEVIGWLYVRNVPSSYVPELLNDGEIAVNEHIVVRGGIFASGSRGFCVGKGVWIVDDPESNVYQISGKQLFDQYEVVMTDS